VRPETVWGLRTRRPQYFHFVFCVQKHNNRNLFPGSYYSQVHNQSMVLRRSWHNFEIHAASPDTTAVWSGHCVPACRKTNFGLYLWQKCARGHVVCLTMWRWGCLFWLPVVAVSTWSRRWHLSQQARKTRIFAKLVLSLWRAGLDEFWSLRPGQDIVQKRSLARFLYNIT